MHMADSIHIQHRTEIYQRIFFYTFAKVNHNIPMASCRISTLQFLGPATFQPNSPANSAAA